MIVWENPIREPKLRSRIFWDLARDACPLCDAGDFPLTPGRPYMHPDQWECEATKFHRMNQGKLKAFRGDLIMSRLEIWRPMTLAAIIRRADKQYWQQPDKAATLTDPEYDRVVDRLRAIAPSHPQLGELGR